MSKLEDRISHVIDFTRPVDTAELKKMLGSVAKSLDSEVRIRTVNRTIVNEPHRVFYRESRRAGVKKLNYEREEFSSGEFSGRKLRSIIDFNVKEVFDNSAFNNSYIPGDVKPRRKPLYERLELIMHRGYSLSEHSPDMLKAWSRIGKKVGTYFANHPGKSEQNL